MCCACPVTSALDNPFNALPVDWASDPELLAGLRVDDDDEHDDPVLRWPDGRVVDTWREDYPYSEKMTRDEYEYLKRPLQIELVKMQNWVKSTGQRIVLVFEGRDAAGKGGTIKRFTEHLNPRGASVVALIKPTERERSQWYFQRYVPHLPGAGEIVMFDRSWYNRAGVERVMGFCTAEEYRRFLHQCPIFERLLVEDGILLRKYWFSVSDSEQQKRFESRLDDPMRRMMNRVRCSPGVTENQNLVICSPERTSIRSNSGASRMNSQYSSSVAKPITRSTPARLYQERSNMTISPPAGRCGT